MKEIEKHISNPLLDESFFDQTVNDHFHGIYSFIWRMLRDQDASADITQETFLKCWKARKKFDSTKASIKTWIYTIAHRTALDYLRSKKNRQKHEVLYPTYNNDAEDTQEFDFKDEAPIQDAIFERKELAEVVQRAFEELSIEQKEIITLYFESNLSLNEIAEIIGKPANTIKSLHRRGMQKLSATLKLHPKLQK